MAFFSQGKAKDRETKRLDLASAVADDKLDRLRSLVEERRDASPPLMPFHWGIEFPEVFDRSQGGFDVFVGNPPFLARAAGFHLPWAALTGIGCLIGLPRSHGNADLVAHFFRRAFSSLRTDGTFGLIATNTIGQGDTRQLASAGFVPTAGDLCGNDVA